MQKFIFTLLLLITCNHSLAKTEQKNKTVLVLGDSLSAGYNIPLKEGWVNLLRQRIKQNKLPYSVINASVSGDTTSQGLQRLPSLLSEHKPELVVIELGGNDGLRGFPPSLIKKNLAQLIDLSTKAKATVVLTAIRILPNYGQRYSSAFYNNYQQLAESKQVILVPFLLDKVGGIADLMQKDGIHPNQKAQPILLDNVWQKMEPLLSKEQ